LGTTHGAQLSITVVLHFPILTSIPACSVYILVILCSPSMWSFSSPRSVHKLPSPFPVTDGSCVLIFSLQVGLQYSRGGGHWTWKNICPLTVYF